MVVESDIFKITRQGDLAAIVKQAVPNVSVFSGEEINQEELSDRLARFLKEVFHDPNSGAVAIVDRKENYVPPRLDIYVLWSHPIDLSSDSQRMRQMNNRHAELFEPFHPAFSSFLHLVDPRRYPSAEVLFRDLAVRAESAVAARVIACASFIRNKPLPL